MTEGTYNWEPLSVDEVVELMSGLATPWWIAGGWAIDLFLGRQTRTHADIDVLIRRDDQLIVQEYLADWDLYKTQQPGLKSWPAGEFLNRPIDDIWCRRTPDAPWALQLMLLDTDGDRWVFKRDATIGGALAEIGGHSTTGIPYLRPEIQLLYKAKPHTLTKDQSDFDLAVPCLTREAQAWLLRQLLRRFPEGHDWITALTAITTRRNRGQQPIYELVNRLLVSNFSLPSGRVAGVRTY
ncbi:MAG: nucleotidyltransferase domain-containing protein, partial [Armatimonadota bacterium]